MYSRLYQVETIEMCRKESLETADPGARSKS